MPWRRKRQPTPVFLPGESQGWGSLVGCCLWGRTESDTTEATQQQHSVGCGDQDIFPLLIKGLQLIGKIFLSQMGCNGTFAVDLVTVCSGPLCALRLLRWSVRLPSPTTTPYSRQGCMFSRFTLYERWLGIDLSCLYVDFKIKLLYNFC